MSRGRHTHVHSRLFRFVVKLQTVSVLHLVEGDQALAVSGSSRSKYLTVSRIKLPRTAHTGAFLLFLFFGSVKPITAKTQASEGFIGTSLPRSSQFHRMREEVRHTWVNETSSSLASVVVVSYFRLRFSTLAIQAARAFTTDCYGGCCSRQTAC